MGSAPELLGVHALGGHFLQGGHDDGLVGGVGDTVPLIGRGQNLDGGLVLVQQGGDAGGQEELCLAGVLAQNGVTTGTTSTTFSPDMELTRAQAVTFLWAAAGKPEPTGENSFVDVKESDWFYKAVLWAAEAGVTSGTGHGGFAPNAVCTREQVVTFLYASKGKPSVSAEVTFPDVPGNAWYYDAVSWAVENKVTSGMGDGRFGVGVICTRAQVVTFLYAANN